MSRQPPAYIALLASSNDPPDRAKVEAGALEPARAPFELRAELAATLGLVAARAAGKQLSLESAVAAAAPERLLGDWPRVRQILLNLLSNAINATDSGAIEVAVDSRALPDGRCELQFAVRDTGIGIPVDRLDQLFTTFSQSDLAAAHSRGGGGLGLALSKRLAELLGGRIWVVSEPGGGSTFSFTVLAAPEPPAEAPAPAPPGRQWPAWYAALPADAGQVRVLVAEDNELLQHMFLALLGHAGYQAQAVDDGRQAIEAIERERFDVLLLDVQMPELSGLEVAGYVCRRWPTEQRPYMIALTANAIESDRELCLSAGMNDYLSKPVRFERLIQAIEARRRPGRPAAPPEARPLYSKPAWPGAATTTTPAMVLDQQIFARIQAVLGERLAQFIESYHADSLALIERMHTAIAQGDARSLGQAGHKLISSSTFLGASQLAALCAEIEQRSRSDAPEGCRELVAQIERAFAAAYEALLQANT